LSLYNNDHNYGAYLLIVRMCVIWNCCAKNLWCKTWQCIKLDLLLTFSAAIYATVMHSCIYLFIYLFIYVSSEARDDVI